MRNESGKLHFSLGKLRIIVSLNSDILLSSFAVVFIFQTSGQPLSHPTLELS